MNKEQQQIIDEAYQNYLTNFIPPICPPNLDVQPSYYEPMTKEWFIKSIKERGLRGEEFSETWGLKIEERELSNQERSDLKNSPPYDYGKPANGKLINERLLDSNKVPTRLITLKYNNEKITSYE